MKTERIAFSASVVFMVIAWLILTSFLVLAFMGGLTKSAIAHTLLGLVIVAWVLIPIQVVRYYRKQRTPR